MSEVNCSKCLIFLYRNATMTLKALLLWSSTTQSSVRSWNVLWAVPASTTATIGKRLWIRVHGHCRTTRKAHSKTKVGFESSLSCTFFFFLNTIVFKKHFILYILNFTELLTLVNLPNKELKSLAHFVYILKGQFCFAGWQ